MKYLALLLIFGFGLSGFGQTIKSLGYNTTNGQVVANTGTNKLTFTNSILTTSISVNGATNTEKRGQIFIKQQATNIAADITMWSPDEISSASIFSKKQNLQTNWNITSWGNNIAINENNEHSLRNIALPASYISIENNYDSSAAGSQYGDSITELYFTTVASNSFNVVRGWGLNANQKYPSNGVIYHRYPTIIISSEETRRLNGTGNHFWDEYYPFKVVDTSSSGQGLGGLFQNPSTNNNASIRVDWTLQGQFSSDVFWIRKFKDKIELRNNPDGFTMMSSTTNGVLIGGQDSSNALSRVHLGGNTRIDGAISFNAASNAAITRTNLGLGGGITATNTFVSYNGTNYTTNTVTISNGIITGWTQ